MTDQAKDATETVEFKTLDDAMTYVEEFEGQGNSAVQRYHHAVKELTGIAPGKPLSPLDVVRIVRKVFGL